MAWIRTAEHEGGRAFLELDVVDRLVHAVRVHNETGRVLVIIARASTGQREAITREFLAPGGTEITRTVPPGLRSRLDVGVPAGDDFTIPPSFSVSTHLLGPGQDESAIP